MPAITGLRLELVGDQLTVTATDLDLTIQVVIAVGGDRDGHAVVPARLTTDIVRAFSSGKVEVDDSDDDVVISSGRSQFSVRPFNYDDYPKVGVPTTQSITLPSATLGEALRQVVRAASSDEQRAAITGVQMTAEANGLRLVATDSYRLAIRDLVGQETLAADQRVLVPARALSELQRLVNGADSVVMRLGDRHATFQAGNTSLTTRLIEHEFPPYKALIPADHPNLLTVEREALLDAVRRVKLLAKDSTPLRVEMGGDTVKLHAISPDIGNATEEIDAQYVGEPLVIAFNPDLLSSGVEACQSDTVTLSSVNPQRPVILRGAGVDDYLYLLMPVRVP
jgi:DNA polymerase-3 subunit beta